MKYKIIRTDKADEQLREVIFYIAEDSGSIDIARYSILKKQGFRVLIVERHLVFYKINEDKKEVVIYAVVDGRREYRNLI